MTSDSHGTPSGDSSQAAPHANGSGNGLHTNGAAPNGAFALPAADLLESFSAASESDVYERCEALARQTATALNHGEWTFAHLLLALTQVPEAREKMQEYRFLDAVGAQRSFNVEGARRAAFGVLTALEQGSPALMEESGELKTILNAARLKARKRERVYLTRQPIAVKDILDAVVESGGEAPAFRMLNSHLPSAPLLEVRDSLLYLRSEMGKQATWNLGLVQRIALMDEQLHGKLATLDATVKGQPKEIIAGVKTQRRPLLVASGIAGALALGLMGGFMLGTSDAGNWLLAWLGQWIV